MSNEPDDKGYKRVVFSADCDEDGNCPHCAIDFGDCDCPGPTQDGMVYLERGSVLYAKPEPHGGRVGYELQGTSYDPGAAGHERVGRDLA